MSLRLQVLQESRAHSAQVIVSYEAVSSVLITTKGVCFAQTSVLVLLDLINAHTK